MNLKETEIPGLRIEEINMGKPGQSNFTDGALEPYSYFFYKTLEQESITWENLKSVTIYLLNVANNSVVTLVNTKDNLQVGDAVQAENSVITLKVEEGPVEFLVAGTEVPQSEKEEVKLTQYSDLYRVTKPWGHELWINGQHPGYCLKQVYIKSGTKTSLQYHQYKQETNVLFEGEANIHYKNNQSIHNDDVTSKDTGYVNTFPVSVVNVLPGTLHRVEAVTNITLYETSTPYLDDVIRVQDDSGRSHGRIHKEHQR